LPPPGRDRLLKSLEDKSGTSANTKLLAAETPRKSSIWPPSGHIFISKLRGEFARKWGARMALSLRDVRCDPVANRALNEVMHHYTVAPEKSRLVLTKKTGDMKLFLNDLDDLHQWDFMRNQQMVKEIERLHVLLTTTNQKRESWKVRALMAETQLLEATAKTSNNGGRQNVSDVRYASLKRYLAKRFHPDFAPGEGIEKVVRNEIFKEVWNAGWAGLELGQVQNTDTRKAAW
jgi:hypothetical protein